jgi:putative ABC transport system permease protein
MQGRSAMIHSPRALWHQRQRFLPAVLVVACSALLIILQAGLLVGFFSLKSIPVDHAAADLWIAHPAVQSVDMSRPFPEQWLDRVASQPEVVRVECLLTSFLTLNKPDGQSEQCMLIGSRLDKEALGAVSELSPQLRQRLSEPGTIVADETDMGSFGRGGSEDIGEAMGRRVRLVGRVPGVKGLGAAYLFCSLETARMLCRGIRPDEVSFLLVRCRNSQDAERLKRRLSAQHHMAVFTRDEFSSSTRLYWLTKTQAGTATAWTAALGLLVGIAITSQILYGATASYRREYAVLRALGIPRWRMTLAVLGGSFWVGCAGIGLAIVGAFGMVRIADFLAIKVLLTPKLLAGGAVLTIVMALLATLAALRAQRRIEPAELLR